jgi:hypothetical protein
MDGELEYLIKAWKRVCKCLRNAEAVGAITVEDAKTSVQRLQEETLGARNCGISGSCVDGREPTRNWKRQDSLVENRHKQWELLATHSGCGCVRCMSENCNGITNPEILFHTG